MPVKVGPGGGRYISVISIFFIFSLTLLFFCLVSSQVRAGEQDDGQMSGPDFPEYSDWYDDFMEEDAATIKDPLEPANRIFFKFNDKLYFWFLKPVASAYGKAVPRDFRISFRNCFNNLEAPVHMSNDFLQGKFKDGFVEACRFFINSTVGILGLSDAARDVFALNSPGKEDLGQTIGYYGIGNGFYLCWPFMGPSTLRDTVGMTGDFFLRPGTYMASTSSLYLRGLFFSGRYINNTSLRIGDYEDFLVSTFDPYLAMRDAYIQRRFNMIEE
ncbi:MAG: VacJ family lipoprotein [Desulfobia sp.]